MAYIDLQTATIGAGAALSAEVALGEKTLVGIIMPAAWTAASITLQGTVDDQNFGNVFTAAGTEYTITTPGVNQFIALDPTILRGLLGVKVRSGTSAAPVNQVAQAVLTLVTRTIY